MKSSASNVPARFKRPLDEVRPEAGLATRCIHGGAGPDPATGAILPPIHQSTTFVQTAVGVDRGYTYSRSANPTVRALEEALASLSGASPAVGPCDAVAFATGLAAISTLFLSTCRAGDRILVSDVVYGGTVRLLRSVLARFELTADFVDCTDDTALDEALARGPRLVFLETPANPTLKLVDVADVARRAHAVGALVAVDDTFLTPALQDVLGDGADVGVYSTTKFLDGHNATVGGALVVRASDEALLESFRFTRNASGNAQKPFDAFLTLQGLKTLPLRMERHAANALEVARALEAHPSVARVSYPFLESFPQVELARRQQRAGGGLLAFELEGGLDAGRVLMRSFQTISLAENLGSAESLATHPASMTHGAVPPEERERLGITDGLVRLSVGLEDAVDVIADLGQALACVQREPSEVAS